MPPHLLAEVRACDSDDDLLELAATAPAASGSVVPVSGMDELERILSKPIEDWMIFLHPAQRAVVEERTFGPARVRGAAGTGKTVVALHRAAFLARELDRRGDSGRVLFTTFIRSLPVVLANLFERLAPDVADRVEFINVHSWALGLLRARGLPHQIDSWGTGLRRPDQRRARFPPAAAAQPALRGDRGGRGAGPHRGQPADAHGGAAAGRRAAARR